MDMEGRNNIVEYLDSFKFRQHVVIIFEFLHYNLYKYMKCNKNLEQIFSDSLLRTVCLQMVQGLKYMKNKGVIHCDVKPENILFADDKFRNVKLIDFGSSCENYKLGFSYV